MTLWQEILLDHGDACYRLSFEDLADEYNTTEMAIGNAIAAIKRRNAMCGSVEYANGDLLSLKKMVRKKRQPKRKRQPCGCRD